MLVDVAYVGNRADDLLLFANFNQARPNNAAGTIPLQARRPIPEFADITYSFNGGKSRYHALQAKFDWRMRGGLSLLSSLTLSQTKDNGAGSLEGGTSASTGNYPAPQNFYDMDADFGISPYHQPYTSTTSFVWNLPFTGAFAGGWQVSGINNLYTGEYVTFSYNPAATFQVSGIQQDFRGANNYRPNIVGDPLVPKDQRTVQNWFNRDAVVIPTDPSQPFGNAPRNSVRAPFFWQVDMAVAKRVSLGGSSTVELRAEFFNLFNRANFRAPNANRSAGGFGTITQTYDPRQVQFGAKVSF
jgi:hypothetical protein